MADLSKMQVGTTVYNMKDVTARNSLTPATQTKMGLMSAADKNKLDNTPDIVVIDLSVYESSDNYDLINHAKSEIAAAADSGKVIYITWNGLDGQSLHPTTYVYDGSEFFFTIWGDPTVYSTDGSSVIAVEYMVDGDLATDGFTQYRTITATKSDFINL